MGCRTVLEKRDLMRIVRTNDGVFVDLTGKMSGRGAYLHNELSCWEKGMKGSLAHALKVQFTAEDKNRLLIHQATLLKNK